MIRAPEEREWPYFDDKKMSDDENKKETGSMLAVVGLQSQIGEANSGLWKKDGFRLP